MRRKNADTKRPAGAGRQGRAPRGAAKGRQQQHLKMERSQDPASRRRARKSARVTYAPSAWAPLLALALLAQGAANCAGQPQELGAGPAQRHSDKDFAPRLTHAPHSVHALANQPQTVDCPVESEPDSEVKWFKDDQLLESEPAHLEQTGKELMFFQINDNDTGDYYCQATNYLGTVTSERFKLTVQSSVHDPNVRLEPHLAEVASGQQQVEFTCSIPASWLKQQQQQQRSRSKLSGPEVVSWRRNGRRLHVTWIAHEPQADSANNDNNKDHATLSRFVARQSSPNEFVLTITRLAQLKDDNTTFTCLYKDPSMSPSAGIDDNNGELAHESSPARVQFIKAQQPVKIDPSMAPPIDGLADSRHPHLLNPSSSYFNNHTTQLVEPRRITSLSETLRDLYEIAKPSLIIFGVLCVVGLVILLQFIFIRKRARENRYMKHQYSTSGGGSGTSSAIGGSLDCDPVLSSLLGRTLSAPSASSLTGASKKYKSYRDHMRKVAAASDLVNNDFIDASYFNVAHPSQPQQHQSVQNNEHEPFFATSALPNLYNQSLAAREQARSLLQASEHMRSLSNLSSHGQGYNNKQNGGQHHSNTQGFQRTGALNGSSLNLPFSFAFDANRGGEPQANNPLDGGASQLVASAIWPSHLIQFASRNLQQQQQQQSQQARQPSDEHYQLVSCSSVSPSSSSSIVGSNSSGKEPVDHHHQPQSETLNKQQQTKSIPRESISSNHYSTIETNDEDDRYEELDRANETKISSTTRSRNQQDSFRLNNNRTSIFATNDNLHNRKSSAQLKTSLISSSQSNSSSSGCGDSSTTSSSLAGDAFARFGSKRNSRGNKSIDKTTSITRQHKFQDQLSPYAVSSICGNIPQPPPVNSEAMRALNEQFDINQLMLLEDSGQVDHSMEPFDSLPPPPPPQTDCPQPDHGGRSQRGAANKNAANN